jgi:histidinol-phosphate aminotransferase
MKALRKRPALSPAELRPRPELARLPAGVHGGIDPAELVHLGLDAGQIVDFSVNTNPFGPAPQVREVLANVALDQYPDPEARALRQALAEHLGISPAEILAGNGASELIWLVALTFLERGTKVLILGPTYGEYARTSALMGASVTALLARPQDEFAMDPDQVLHEISRFRPRLVFLCSPNNPTGAFLEPEVIAFWARRFPHILFVVDEAYLGFVAEGICFAERLQGMNNLLRLRSITKDLGLAGLRLGYAMGSREVIGWLAQARPPWSVSALAQAAGIEALRHHDYYQNCLTLLAAAKTDFVCGLTRMGYHPVPSAMPFFLMPVEDGAGFRFALLKRGILVRDGASFGLRAHVRVATRRPTDNARLLEALREVPYAG